MKHVSIEKIIIDYTQWACEQRKRHRINHRYRAGTSGETESRPHHMAMTQAWIIGDDGPLPLRRRSPRGR